MSVIIKGMEMPSCCDECWALDAYGDYPVCQITEEQRGYNFRIREKRMDNCPLVEVKEPSKLEQEMKFEKEMEELLQIELGLLTGRKTLEEAVKVKPRRVR